MFDSRVFVRFMACEHKCFYRSVECCLHVIPDGIFTVGEINELKELDEADLLANGVHFVANFLPDGERPADVPGYEETLRRAKKG